MIDKGKQGQLIVTELKELKEQLGLMLKHTSVSLIGPSGSGKTTIAESLLQDESLGIDEMITLRMQGMSSEDFRMPIVNTITTTKDGTVTTEKEVELVNMGIFNKIVKNKDKQYLLFLDEFTRSESSIVPQLFGLLERRFNGQILDNVYVLTAFNYGDEYISNFDFSDSALRRRTIFIEYQPSKEDILYYMEEKKYNEIIREIVSEMTIDNIISHEKTTVELEQDSQLGSWHLLNERWKKLDIKDYDEALNDMNIAGVLFFSATTNSNIRTKILMLKELKQVDIQTEIIDNNGLEKDFITTLQGTKMDIKNKKQALIVKTKIFILQKAISNSNYLKENISKIILVFKNELTLLNILFKEIKQYNKDHFENWLDNQNKMDIMIIKAINEAAKKDEKVASCKNEYIKANTLSNLA